MPQTAEENFSLIGSEGSWERAFSYHPFNVEIAKADGIYIHDTRGNRFIDATGGPFAVNLGYGHPRMKAAIAAQLDDYAYAHPMLANRRRADLCEALASITPAGLRTSYLVSGGSEAVETALKIARQYHVACDRPGKHKIISHYESYHGMTIATMGLSGNPATLRHYDPMVARWPKVLQYSDVRRPAHLSREEWAVETAQELERLIHFEGPGTIAAFIATPHGCGADYGVVPPQRYWQEIRRICDESDVLLIVDEVVTGFGRTGRWFGMDHFGVTPDMMTFAKGISSSYVPLGAVTVSDKVNAPFRDGAHFVHGFTNGGHPLACAAGVALIEILKSERLVEQARERGEQLFGHAERLLAHPSVADVRGWGLFMVLELVQDRKSRSYFPPEAEAEKRFCQRALSNGLVFYSTLHGPRRHPSVSRGLPMWISPPFIITADQVEDLVDRLDRTLYEWEREMGLASSSMKGA